MDIADDAESRIRRSIRTLREWQWMAPLSTDPQTLLVHLRKEAKALIALGLEHPRRAGEIGKIVVAYHRLMVTVKASIERADCKPSKSGPAQILSNASGR